MPPPYDFSDYPVRRLPQERRSFVQMLLAMLCVLSSLMLWLAVPNLVSGSGGLVAFKAALLALGGVTVSYGVNKLAVERGAPLAMLGYVSAGIASVVSILAVGFGLFAATYSGLVLRDVSDIALEAHGVALSETVSQHAQLAAQAGRVAPVMAAVVNDLTAKLDCEIKASCVSGRPNGGHGPIARSLTEKQGHAKAISQQIETGGAARLAILNRLNEMLNAYRAAAQATDLSVKDKRAALQRIDSSIRQGLAELDEAMPTGLVRAYAAELAKGDDVLEQAENGRRLSAILRGHGASLNAVLGDGNTDKDKAGTPVFPPPTGVADTIAYIGHFFPIAAIAGVVELVFPIVLWLYTALTISWGNYLRAAPPERAPHPHDVVFAHLHTPPVLPPPAPRLPAYVGQEAAHNDDMQDGNMRDAVMRDGTFHGDEIPDDEIREDTKPVQRKRGRPPGRRT